MTGGALETSGFPVSPTLLVDEEPTGSTGEVAGAVEPFGVGFATEPLVGDGVDPRTVEWNERTQTHLWPEATKRASTHLVSKWPGSVECTAD